MSDRFTDISGLKFLASCATCKHKHKNAATCEAFPDGIPRVILLGENKHVEPFDGDNGIQYEKQDN